MGGDTQPATQQTVQTTGSANPQVTATVNKILGGVNTAFDAGAPPTFNSSLYSPAGATTQQGWQSALTAANNPTYAADTAGTIASLGKAASGQDYGTNDPAFATLRANAANDAQTAINGQFNNSGRFGGGSNALKVGEGVTNALAGIDVNQLNNDRAFQLSAANALPGAYQSSLLPSSTIAGVGAATDANNQGILQGKYDLNQRTNNNQTDWLAKLSSILQAPGALAGSTSTTTSPAPQQTPWYQSILGLGTAALGAFG